MFSIFTRFFGGQPKKKEVVSEEQLSKNKSNTARDLLLNRNFDDALANAESAIVLDADNIDAYIVKGCALERLGKSIPAVIVFEEVLARRPDCAIAKMEMGYLYYRYENFEGAFEKFHEVCCVDGLWSHEAHFWRGVSGFFARHDYQALISLGMSLEIGGVYERPSCGRLLDICQRHHFEAPELVQFMNAQEPVVPVAPLDAILDKGASYLLGLDTDGALSFL